MRSQRGSGSLIAMLIVLAIMGVLAAAIVPNGIRAAQTLDASTAATVLARIDFAELEARQTYAGYMAPSALAASNLMLSVSACNPGLLSPLDAQPIASNGYLVTWTPIGAGTPATGCTTNPPTIYQNYSITAAPISRLNGARYFYSDTTTGLIYSNDGAPITAADPSKIYTQNVAGGVVPSGSGANQAGGFTPWQGNWQSGKAYVPGSEVLYAADGSASIVYLEVSGSNDGNAASTSIAPPLDPGDWSAICTTTPAPVGSVTYATGSYPSSITLNANYYYGCALVGACAVSPGSSISSVVNVTGQANPTAVGNPVFVFTTTAPVPGSGAMNVWVFPAGSTSQISSTCFIPGGSTQATSGSGPCTTSPLVAGSQYVVVFELTPVGGISSFSPGPINWSVTAQ